MRDKFYEYIEPKTDEIGLIWEKGIISIDANILLNFYRYTEKTRDDFSTSLEKHRDQLWLTHQAGEEFFRNRRNLLKTLKNSYESLGDEIENKIKDLKHQINSLNHPLIEANPINEHLDICLEAIKDNLKILEKKHPNYSDNDIILDRIVDLFEQKIGSAFSAEKLKEIHTDGRDRYEKKIPPGFCDAKCKKESDSTNCYGDLVLWMQLIEESKKNKLPVIFVTDDNKEDWWIKENGKSISPRRELIREFHDMTGERILIYNSMDFLRYTKDKNESSVKEETIIEVERISSEQHVYIEMFSGNSPITPSMVLENKGGLSFDIYIDKRVGNELIADNYRTKPDGNSMATNIPGRNMITLPDGVTQMDILKESKGGIYI